METLAASIIAVFVLIELSRKFRSIKLQAQKDKLSKYRKKAQQLGDKEEIKFLDQNFPENGTNDR